MVVAFTEVLRNQVSPCPHLHRCQDVENWGAMLQQTAATIASQLCLKGAKSLVSTAACILIAFAKDAECAVRFNLANRYTISLLVKAPGLDAFGGRIVLGKYSVNELILLPFGLYTNIPMVPYDDCQLTPSCASRGNCGVDSNGVQCYCCQDYDNTGDACNISFAIVSNGNPNGDPNGKICSSGTSDGGFAPNPCPPGSYQYGT